MNTKLTVGGMIIAGVGMILALSNPGQKAYEEYATEKLNQYLKEEVCVGAPQLGGGDFLRNQCYTLVDTSSPQIKQLIARKTQRNNFLVFSIYETDLSLAAPLPSYHFGTIGILQNFYLYEAEKRD